MPTKTPPVTNNMDTVREKVSAELAEMVEHEKKLAEQINALRKDMRGKKAVYEYLANQDTLIE